VEASSIASSIALVPKVKCAARRSRLLISTNYLRLLSEAQREVDTRREEQERQNRERQAERDRERSERQEREAAPAPKAQPDVNDPGAGDQPDVVESADSNLVETPEQAPKPKPKPRARKPRKPKAEEAAAPKPDTPDSPPETPEAAE